MMVLLAVLLLGDDAAQAGAAYQEAEEAIHEAHYDLALQKLQEAVRFEPRETDRLIYRDRQGRQKLAYFPHYRWAQIRTLQARAEKDPQVRIQWLHEAQSRLSLSSHPEAGELLAATTRDLALAEKAAAAPAEADPVQAELRTEVTALLDRERFEEAAEKLRGKKEWQTFPAERDQFLVLLDARRASALTRYERTMTLALGTAAATSPVEKPDLIPSLLQTALPPPAVLRKPQGAFLWLQDFLTLYGRELPLLRDPARADLPSLLGAMKAFEESAARAAETGTLPGFWAAAHVSDVLRETRLDLLWRSADDRPLEVLLRESEAILQNRERVLSKADRPKDEKDSWVQDLGPMRELLCMETGRMEERRALRRGIQDWVDRADRALASGISMSDPIALRSIAAEESALEKQARWSEMPPQLQAQALFMHAIVDLVADGLGAGGTAAPKDETAARLRKARLLDPKVEDAWADRLSPKLQRLISELER